MQQVVLVTGGASGIGRALVQVLYTRGARLLVTDISLPGLEALADAAGWRASDRVVWRTLDVRDPAAWETVVTEARTHFGRLDVLMNVAGVLSTGWAHELDAHELHRMVDINVKGLMFGTNAAARCMIAQGAGHIVNVASVAGLMPVPGLAAYSASKHAARAYSVAVGQELRKHGVYVTAVCPGLVRTPMMDQQLHHATAALSFSTQRPLETEEVVAAILDRALVHKPLELPVVVPGSRQALGAKLLNMFPRLSQRVLDRVAARAARSQKKLRAGNTPTA